MRDPTNHSEANRAMNAAIFLMDAFVFGAIDENGKVNLDRCKELCIKGREYKQDPIYKRLDELETKQG